LGKDVRKPQGDFFDSHCRSSTASTFGAVRRTTAGFTMNRVGLINLFQHRS